jgi:RHS repeat-associated protein
MYDTPLNEVITQSPYSNGEYVELYNAGYQSVDLTGWELLGEGVTERYVFSGVNIAPKSYLIVAYRHNQSSNFVLEDLYQGINPSANDATIYQNKVVLSNTKEYIRLKDAGGLLRDSIYYGNVTSIQPISARLIATNDSQTPGSDCVSVHRVTPVFDEMGCAIASHLQWTTGIVTPFGLHAGFEEPPISTIDYTTLSGHNYIITSVPKSETTSATPGSNGELTTIQYFDGLGRPIQTVQMGITPDNNDLVTYQEYDGFGRESNSWLPRVAEGNNGAFIDFESFVNLPKDIYNEDASPYSETRYEPSPLNRITEQYGPGFAWYNNNKRVITSYGTNDGSVACFHVDESGRLVRDGNYLPSTLYKTTVTDEDGKASCEYTDKLGQMVLKQAFNNGEKLNTYYVYNDLGQLSYVIPPIAADSLPNTTGTIYDNNGVLKRYAYLYKYDERGNQIYKRLPGCEPVLMVYDKANRLILSQDGNQKNKQQWLVNKYDVLGRLLYTGIIEDSLSHEDLIADLRDEIIIESWNTASDIDNTGYTCGRFTPDKLLTVNYYDNYNFVTLTDVNLDYDASKENEYGYKYPSAKGLLTGTRIYLLDDSNNYTATAQYYDYKGQMIQSRSSNHLGGYDYIYNQYNFTGNVTRTLQEHNIAGQPTVTELYEYDYDHALRPTTVNYTLNSNDRVLLASNKYDELGRLIEKKRHDNTDAEQFEYNIRGWTTKLKSGNFEQNLYYNTGLPQGITSNYNGNISLSTWTYDGLTKKYGYSYDELNRLTSSTFYDINNQPSGSYAETFTYDKMGNVNNLGRMGVSSPIDALTFTYFGNQVIKIDDWFNSQSQYSVKEYHDKADLPVEFIYDKNGNMTADLDRDIVTIKYNLLNLPDTVQFKNGNLIINQYDASGRKINDVFYTYIYGIQLPLTVGTVLNPNNYGDEFEMISNRHYIDNFTYRFHFMSSSPGRLDLDKVYNEYGYVDILEEGSLFRYNYYRRDHLGNVREVWQPSYTVGGSIYPAVTVQRTQYYPSGLPWKYNIGDNPGEQPYKYGGKEFVEMHGLDEYDSDARWYYPAIMRTTTMDPLAEKYYDISPYAWCGNNPVKFVDPDGRIIVDSNGVRIYKNGEWTGNNSYGARRIGEAMMNTPVGKELFNQLANSAIPVELILDQGVGDGTKNGTVDIDHTNKTAKIIIFEGKAIDKLTELKNAQIAIDLGGTVDPQKTAESDKARLANMPVSVEEIIGQKAVHEAAHVLDKGSQERYQPDENKREKFPVKKEIEAVIQTPEYRIIQR